MQVVDVGSAVNGSVVLDRAVVERELTKGIEDTTAHVVGVVTCYGRVVDRHRSAVENTPAPNVAAGRSKDAGRLVAGEGTVVDAHGRVTAVEDAAAALSVVAGERAVVDCQIPGDVRDAAAGIIGVVIHDRAMIDLDRPSGSVEESAAEGRTVAGQRAVVDGHGAAGVEKTAAGVAVAGIVGRGDVVEAQLPVVEDAAAAIPAYVLPVSNSQIGQSVGLAGGDLKDSTGVAAADRYSAAARVLIILEALYREIQVEEQLPVDQRDHAAGQMFIEFDYITVLGDRDLTAQGAVAGIPGVAVISDNQGAQQIAVFQGFQSESVCPLLGRATGARALVAPVGELREKRHAATPSS